MVEIGGLAFRMICPTAEGQMTGSARYEAEDNAGSGRLELHFRSDKLEGKLIIETKTKRIGDC